MERAKDDIKCFIKEPKVLDIWSPSYFHKLVEQLKINSNQSYNHLNSSFIMLNHYL